MHPDLQCACCGNPATHLYGMVDLRDGLVSSVCGPGHFAPSCDDCDDPQFDAGMEDALSAQAGIPSLTVRAPLPVDLQAAAANYLTWVAGLPEVQS
jgi:hypothetical protein